VRKQDIVAAIDAESCSRDVMDDVVDDLDVVSLVPKPWSCHVLNPGALPRRDTSLKAVSELIAFDANVRRAALDVRTPALRI
jgi:hypothetical protein